jgi:hypothetical protein
MGNASKFLLDLERICRNISVSNRTRTAGGFSERLSLGNQLTPAHLLSRYMQRVFRLDLPHDSDVLITL